MVSLEIHLTQLHKVSVTLQGWKILVNATRKEFYVQEHLPDVIMMIIIIIPAVVVCCNSFRVKSNIVCCPAASTRQRR